MPYKSKKPCKYPGCPNLTTGYYCELHKALNDQNYDTHKRPYKHKERYDARWNKVRDIYIKRQPLCEECLKNNITTKATIVHHKIPISDGGEILNIENLESVCASCHARIHKELERNKKY